MQLNYSALWMVLAVISILLVAYFLSFYEKKVVLLRWFIVMSVILLSVFIMFTLIDGSNEINDNFNDYFERLPDDAPMLPGDHVPSEEDFIIGNPLGT